MEYFGTFILFLVLVLGILAVLATVHSLGRQRKLIDEAKQSGDPYRAMELLLDALNRWKFVEIHDTAGQVSKDLSRLASTVKEIAKQCDVQNIKVNTEDLESVIEKMKDISGSKTWRFLGFGFLEAETKTKYKSFKGELDLLRTRLVEELRIHLEEQKANRSNPSIGQQ